MKENFYKVGVYLCNLNRLFLAVIEKRTKPEWVMENLTHKIRSEHVEHIEEQLQWNLYAELENYTIIRVIQILFKRAVLRNHKCTGTFTPKKCSKKLSDKSLALTY